MHLIHVTPNFSPQVCGIGDYCALLSARLRDLGLKEQSIVTGPKSGPLAQLPCADEMTVFRVAEWPSMQAIHETIEKAMRNATESRHLILVHYSGYGYSRRGSPHQLVRALVEILSKRSDVCAITLFHELYPLGMGPWRQAFWWRASQKGVVRDLCELSLCVITSNDQYQRRLERFRGKVPVHCSPIPSNLGESLDGGLPFKERNPSILVGGLRSSRREVARAAIRALEYLGRMNLATEIIELGPGESAFDGHPNVRFLGFLSGPDYIELLRQSRWLISNVGPELLGKSTMHAAGEAHGCLSINGLAKSEAELVKGERFEARNIMEHCERARLNVWTSYMTNRSWISHARAMYSILCSNTPDPRKLSGQGPTVPVPREP